MKNTKNAITRAITRGAAVAALYTALTLVSAVFGLSSGVIQLRLSESLCLLPLVMPEAVLGLYVGCIISNLITGCAFWDIIFGSLATLIGENVEVSISGAGLGDTTSEPSGIIALYNALNCTASLKMYQNRSHTYNPPVADTYTISK